MKVIHIITGLNNGGAEGVLYRLCKYDNKYQHIVISMMDEGKYGSLLEDVGIDVYCLHMPQGRVSLSGLWQLFKLLRKHKPDVVQTWMYHADLIGGVVAKLARVKSIFWNVRHTTLESGKSKRSTIWVAKVCSLASGWIPAKIIYCAHEAKSVHEQMGYKKVKSVVIGNGYDLSQFKPDNAFRSSFRSEVGLSENDVVVGMVGRYDPQKDHANLIDAFSMVKKSGYSFKLVLIGRGLDSTNQVLLDYIEGNELSEDVLLLGQRTDIPIVMNGLDFHVLSSSFGEAFPNVLAESMACGTPCVTTDVGDAALIVGQTGWVVSPKNPQALADDIIQAVNEMNTKNLEWLRRKKCCRIKIVMNYSLEAMSRNYHRVWFGEI